MKKRLEIWKQRKDLKGRMRQVELDQGHKPRSTTMDSENGGLVTSLLCASDAAGVCLPQKIQEEIAI